eukprot:13280062-Alexandrium_andersonii.AAC.1
MRVQQMMLAILTQVVRLRSDPIVGAKRLRLVMCTQPPDRSPQDVEWQDLRRCQMHLGGRLHSASVAEAISQFLMAWQWRVGVVGRVSWLELLACFTRKFGVHVVAAQCVADELSGAAR